MNDNENHAIEQLCRRLDRFMEKLTSYGAEREAYRDALLNVICAADIHQARRIARAALSDKATGAQHARPSRPER